MLLSPSHTHTQNKGKLGKGAKNKWKTKMAHLNPTISIIKLNVMDYTFWIRQEGEKKKIQPDAFSKRHNLNIKTRQVIRKENGKWYTIQTQEI